MDALLELRVITSLVGYIRGSTNRGLKTAAFSLLFVLTNYIGQKKKHEDLMMDSTLLLMVLLLLFFD
jgi:hypothetical protein